MIYLIYKKNKQNVQLASCHSIGQIEYYFFSNVSLRRCDSIVAKVNIISSVMFCQVDVIVLAKLNIISSVMFCQVDAIVLIGQIKYYFFSNVLLGSYHGIGRIEYYFFRNFLLGSSDSIDQIEYYLFRNVLTCQNQTVCSCHVTYEFQSESTLYSCLNVKEFLAQNRREI